MQYEKAKQAYDEILDFISKNKDLLIYNLESMKEKAQGHLWAIELKEKYGFNIDPKTMDVGRRTFYRFGDNLFVGWWGKKHNRTVSWSDDDKQPIDEFLLNISFATGAYIFGDDYPKELFQEFFTELKSYAPKYIDSMNKSLYFSMENAGKVFNDFPNIFKKYYEKNKEDYKKRRAEKLRQELKQLEE